MSDTPRQSLAKTPSFLDCVGAWLNDDDPPIADMRDRYHDILTSRADLKMPLGWSDPARAFLRTVEEILHADTCVAKIVVAITYPHNSAEDSGPPLPDIRVLTGDLFVKMRQAAMAKIEAAVSEFGAGLLETCMSFGSVGALRQQNEDILCGFCVHSLDRERKKEEVLRKAELIAKHSASTRIVCTSTLEPSSSMRNNKDWIARYAPLTKPMALRGGDIDPHFVWKTLAAEFAWQMAAIEWIAGQLAMGSRRGYFWLPPVILVGPPGSGKSSLLVRLAELMGVTSTIFPCANSSDDRVLSGTSKGWESACESLPVSLMLQGACANPVVLCDELEKAGGSDRNGSVHRALLGMIEPTTARAFLDIGLSVAVDLTAVSFLATANSLDGIPAPLLSRFTVLRAPNPDPDLHFEDCLVGACREVARSSGLETNDVHELIGPSPVASEIHKAFKKSRGDLRVLRKVVSAATAAGFRAEISSPRMVH